MPDKFTLTIDLGNDAMQTREEIAEALERVAGTLKASPLPEDTQGIRDANGATVGRWNLSRPNRLESCPECGSALETFLRIDLDNVVVENGELVEFTLAGSANDPSNGIVVEEAKITCVEHEHWIDAEIPMSITEHWRYEHWNYHE